MKSQSFFCSYSLCVISRNFSDIRTLFMFKHSLFGLFWRQNPKNKTSSVAMWVTMKSMNGKIMKEACERWFKFKQNFLTDRHSNLSVLENQDQIFFKKRFRCNGFFQICFFNNCTAKCFTVFTRERSLNVSRELYLVKDTTTS